MLNFEMYLPTRLVFGKDTHKQIGNLLEGKAKKVLIHYGSERIKSNGVFNDVTRLLTEHGIEFLELGGVVPNPHVSLVRKGIEICRANGVDFILAIGGGSIIDSAKAIAMGVMYEGDVWEIFEGKVKVTKALPLGTILTIPAAGSEMSPNTVITNEEEGFKWGFGCDAIRSKVSIINPEFFFTLPEDQIAYGVADMISHIFERYFTQTLNTALTDALCEATLRTIIEKAPKLMKNPRDYDAWAEIGFAGTVAHNDILGKGRVQDWATHGIEHELSAAYDIAHGCGLAILTPAWMRYVKNENIARFEAFARNVMGVEDVDTAIDKLSEFYRVMNLPQKLSEIDIDDSRFEEMASKAELGSKARYGTEYLGNFKKLYKHDILNILELAK